MDCPKCKSEVELTLVNVEKDGDKDGIQISFVCQVCQGEFYAFIMSDDWTALLDDVFPDSLEACEGGEEL